MSQLHGTWRALQKKVLKGLHQRREHVLHPSGDQSASGVNRVGVPKGRRDAVTLFSLWVSNMAGLHSRQNCFFQAVICCCLTLWEHRPRYTNKTPCLYQELALVQVWLRLWRAHISFADKSFWFSQRWKLNIWKWRISIPWQKKNFHHVVSFWFNMWRI